MDLHGKLLEEFERVFGPRSPSTSRFGSNALGEIADQLCLSNSLLTKLISGTATQGMYERCLKNLSRIKEAKRLVAENQKLEDELAKPVSQDLRQKLWLPLLLIAVISSSFSISKLLKNTEPDADNAITTTLNPLDMFFNPPFDKPSFLPYVNSDKVQEFCPCSGFEGDWELNKPYVIPIPFNKPGLYYVAKSTDIKLKCSTSIDLDEGKGKKMHGFETMKHELWMDSEHESLAPKYFNEVNKQYTKEFYNLQFDGNERFDKVAEFTSFFYNSILIEEDKIIRKGEPTGRYANYLNDDAIKKYKINIDDILNHVVGNMIQVSCAEIQNPYCNPNSLVEGESLLDFNCDFTIATENLGYGGTYPYNKGFKLIKQNYSNNLLCDCND